MRADEPFGDFVMVPVPKALVPVVYEMLASHMHLSSPYFDDSSGLPGPKVLVDRSQGRWTQQMVDDLRAEVAGTAIEGVLAYIAEGAPRWVPFSDLCEQSGIPRERLRAELATLSKIVKRLFGRRTWPMSVRSGMVNDEMAYRMPHPVARWWLAAEVV